METPIPLTREEFYEVNDAINEVVQRMLQHGQSAQEIEMESLRHLWSAWVKLTTGVFGNPDTPGLQEIAGAVEEAISNPRQLDPPGKDLH